MFPYSFKTKKLNNFPIYFVFQDLMTVVCSIGIKLTEQEIYQYMQHVVKLDVGFDERYSKILTFPQFIAIMAAIITVNTIVVHYVSDFDASESVMTSLSG